MTQEEELNKLNEQLAEIEKKRDKILAKEKAHIATIAEAVRIAITEDINKIIPPIKELETAGKKPGQPTEISERTITLRLAAIEAVGHLNKTKTISMISIGGLFATMLSSAFGLYVGVGFGMVFVGINIFFLFKADQEIKRLAAKYNINIKNKPGVQFINQ